MLRATLLPLILASACGDPAHDREVSALGPETPGVPAGPSHRPGQPCNACHDGRGPGNLVFALAGTVYRSPGSSEPLPGAIVALVDSALRRHQVAANCSGNFFLLRDDFDPVWPIWVEVRYGGIEAPMNSPIFREGSCGHCHAEPAGPTSVGHVHLVPDGFPIPPSTCP